MAKILLFTDNHFCETSSIVRKIGIKYSVRLENQIQSLNWLENLAVEKECTAVICAGDFFDKPVLTDNELTALRDIRWNDLPHYFLVGNHESEEVDLCYSSTKALENYKLNRFVISEPTAIELAGRLFKFLPYIGERNRQSIEKYFTGEKKEGTVIISHNDIKGLQLGPIETKIGFELEDIKNNCSLFINGHIHNGTELEKNIINLGNFTGVDFKEDATKYKHNILILDTDTLEYELVENPHALKFYHIEINTDANLNTILELPQNSVVSVTCISSLAEKVNKLLDSSQNIVASRVMLLRTADGTAEQDLDDLGITTDYMAKLVEFSHEKLENSEILDYELAEICK